MIRSCFGINPGLFSQVANRVGSEPRASPSESGLGLEFSLSNYESGVRALLISQFSLELVVCLAGFQPSIFS